MPKSNRKSMITKVAIDLFNEKGYDNVSLREIADAAGTTIGNLTYHFPQKEDLIVSIQAGFQTDYLEDSQLTVQDGRTAMELILSLFKKGQNNLEVNPFYFRNLVELSKNNKTIAERAFNFRDKLYRQYIYLLYRFVEYGLMRSDIVSSQYEIMAFTLVVMSSFWVQNTSPYYDEGLPNVSLYHAYVNMIYPYLTPLGVNLLKECGSL